MDINVYMAMLACVVVGYAFGSIPTGVLVGKLFQKDIRSEGSGNIGTTNALRTMGVKGALLTFVGDVLKCVIPVVLMRSFLDEQTDYSYLFGLCGGFGAVLGHNFSCWLKFKGGKGIAVTSAAVLATSDWRIIVAGLLIFIVVVAVTRYVSLGSLFVAWYLPANTLLFHRQDQIFVWMLAISLCYTLLAYIRHKDNIVRLLHGNERKIGEKKEEQK